MQDRASEWRSLLQSASAPNTKSLGPEDLLDEQMVLPDLSLRAAEAPAWLGDSKCAPASQAARKAKQAQIQTTHSRMHARTHARTRAHTHTHGCARRGRRRARHAGTGRAEGKSCCVHLTLHVCIFICAICGQACKNCSCGLAAALAAKDSGGGGGGVTGQLTVGSVDLGDAKSACGGCYRGDAFRFALRVLARMDACTYARTHV